MEVLRGSTQVATCLRRLQQADTVCMKPAMAAESPAFGSDGVHIREVFQRWQLFEYRLPVPVWKLGKEPPNRTSQDDAVFHRFLLRAFFARDNFITSA